MAQQGHRGAQGRAAGRSGPLALFAYGTLRRGAPMPGLIEGRATWVGPADAPGRLVDLGAFPGLVAPHSRADRVVGDLFALEAEYAAALLDALDRYEGASFRRESATVHGPHGEVEAWLYRWTGDVRGRRVVSGGDYLGAVGHDGGRRRGSGG